MNKHIIQIYKHGKHYGYFSHENTNIPRVYKTRERATTVAAELHRVMREQAADPDPNIAQYFTGLEYYAVPISAYGYSFPTL